MIHYYWLVKSDIRLPVMYGVFVGVLLGYRVLVSVFKHKAPAAVKRPASISPGALRDNP